VISRRAQTPLVARSVAPEQARSTGGPGSTTAGDRTDVAVRNHRPAQRGGMHQSLITYAEPAARWRTVVGYEADMPGLLGRATVAVCRAGAGTVAELTAAGLPAVLVPLPGAPSDHQARNASTLADAGAAVVLADADCDAARLDAVVSELLTTPDRLAGMAAAGRRLARPDAAARLADLVEEHARL
jgi:UDP-N-acetylglucosamine--N-acetylmuramyl-(pentapeptide) pyrophosphoryl-undecaprenol N-acetylglucosamine transferase